MLNFKVELGKYFELLGIARYDFDQFLLINLTVCINWWNYPGISRQMQQAKESSLLCSLYRQRRNISAQNNIYTPLHVYLRDEFKKLRFECWDISAEF